MFPGETKKATVQENGGLRITYISAVNLHHFFHAKAISRQPVTAHRADYEFARDYCRHVEESAQADNKLSSIFINTAAIKPGLAKYCLLLTV